MCWSGEHFWGAEAENSNCEGVSAEAGEEKQDRWNFKEMLLYLKVNFDSVYTTIKVKEF